MFLSVVIPTRDRASTLANCLRSLQRQTLPPEQFEVIIVDNGSTDATAAISKRFVDASPNFRYIFEERPGLHNARHAGLKNARGDALVYGDDDIVASSTWLEGVREAFAKFGASLVGGPCLPLFESVPPSWFDSLKNSIDEGWCIGPYSLLYAGDQVREIAPLLVFGCNFSIRRDVLENIGGFHPDGMPRSDIRFRGDGECAVSKAIGTLKLKTIYHPLASVEHLVANSRLTPEYLRWRSYIEGISASYSEIRRTGGISGRSRIRAWIKARGALFRGELARLANRSSEHQHGQLRGFWAGYLYHQREVANDPHLREWVLRETYISP